MMGFLLKLTMFVHPLTKQYEINLCILFSRIESPLRSQSVTDPEQPEEDEEVEEPMLLPPPDYSDSSRDRPIKPSTPSPQNMVNTLHW